MSVFFCDFEKWSLHAWVQQNIKYMLKTVWHRWVTDFFFQKIVLFFPEFRSIPHALALTLGPACAISIQSCLEMIGGMVRVATTVSLDDPIDPTSPDIEKGLLTWKEKDSLRYTESLKVSTSLSLLR